MGIEPLMRHHPIDRVVSGEYDLALRQIEIERRAGIAGALERAIGRVERFEHGSQQGAAGVVGPAVDRALRLHVIELRRRAHEHAMEAVRSLATVGADDEPHRERRAVLAGPQRAQLVGDALGQHRHDPIGEVDGIAAHERLAVGARPHVMADVGDGDRDDEAAGVLRIAVAHSVHRVVVVLGVGRIDGDEGQRAPVLAPGKPGGLGRLRLCQRRGRKDVRDRVGVDGDQADGALGCERAEPFRHARAGEPEATAARRGLNGDEIAVAGLAAGARRDGELAADFFLLNRHDPSAATRRGAENSEHTLAAAVDELDDAPAVADRIFFLAALLDPQQSAVADAGNLAGPGAARNAHANLGRGAVLGLVPFSGERDQLAVGITRGDVGEHDMGQTAGLM